MKKITNDDIQKFKAYLENEEKSFSTLEKYIRDITTFAAKHQNQAITKQLVLEYKKKLCEEYAPASTNSILSSINSFFAFMGWYDLRVKGLKIQRRIFADNERELTKNEYERLLRAAKRKQNRRLYFLMQTICSTGIRVSELRFITVEALRHERATINCKGKIRIVILPRELCKLLLRYATENKIKSGAVFITKTGNPLNRSNIWSDMKKLCASANVSKSKVFPHNLRHLFARTFYSINKDIVRLADLLGHTSVNTTRIYTMETGEVHTKILQKLGLIHILS